MTEEYLTAKQVALELGINQRELRKFLRHADSPFEAVGQGARYQFDREDADLLKAAYEKHIGGKKTRTRKTTQVEEGELVPEPDRSDDAEDYEANDTVIFDDLEDPTEEDLDDIEFDDDDYEVIEEDDI